MSPPLQPDAVEVSARRSRQMEGIFLHFFANVNLTADVLGAMGKYKLGRIDNRILVLTAMSPGLTVSELVRAMRVTHQGLNGSMRRLQKEGYLTAKIGTEDRRQRHLYVTAKGRRLVEAVLVSRL